MGNFAVIMGIILIMRLLVMNVIITYFVFLTGKNSSETSSE